MANPPHNRTRHPAAELLGLAPADVLELATLPQMLLHALVEDGARGPIALELLRALRRDLAGFARLACVASGTPAADLVSVSEHIGPPLAGFVRRLDVALAVLDGLERARGDSSVAAALACDSRPSADCGTGDRATRP